MPIVSPTNVRSLTCRISVHPAHHNAIFHRITNVYVLMDGLMLEHHNVRVVIPIVKPVRGLVHIVYLARKWIIGY
jgi:hypothetical protein